MSTRPEKRQVPKIQVGFEIPIGTPPLLAGARWYAVGRHSVRVTSCAVAESGRQFTAEVFLTRGCRVVRGIGVSDVLFRARLVIFHGCEIGEFFSGRHAAPTYHLRRVAA